MTPLHWKFVGAGSIIAVGVIAFRCAVFADMPLRQCMRLEVLRFIEAGLVVGAWALACWLGLEVTKASKRQWVGVAVGAALIVALTTIIVWIELAPYSSDDVAFDSDDHYRR